MAIEFYCNNCQMFLDGDDVNNGYDKSTGERWLECDICGSDDVQEVEHCSICGRPAIDTFCADCKDTVADTLEGLQQTLGANKHDFEDIVAEYFMW